MERAVVREAGERVRRRAQVEPGQRALLLRECQGEAGDADQQRRRRPARGGRRQSVGLVRDEHSPGPGARRRRDGDLAQPRGAGGTVGGAPSTRPTRSPPCGGPQGVQHAPVRPRPAAYSARYTLSAIADRPIPIPRTSSGLSARPHDRQPRPRAPAAHVPHRVREVDPRRERPARGAVARPAGPPRRRRATAVASPAISRRATTAGRCRGARRDQDHQRRGRRRVEREPAEVGDDGHRQVRVAPCRSCLRRSTRAARCTGAPTPGDGAAAGTRAAPGRARRRARRRSSSRSAGRRERRRGRDEATTAAATRAARVRVETDPMSMTSASDGGRLVRSRAPRMSSDAPAGSLQYGVLRERWPSG